MRRYIARQLTQLVVVIFGISLLAFAILHVLGDPVLLLLPQNAGKAEFERYRHLLGLDRPLYVQYWKFVSGAVCGDFGKSWYADTPAFKLVLERMPATIYLTLAGLVVALLIALPLGLLAALKRNSWIDTLCTALAVAGQATPLFWLGIMLIIIFAVRLKALPASGYGTWQNFVMPAFCLGAALAPITMRLVRSGDGGDPVAPCPSPLGSGRGRRPSPHRRERRPCPGDRSPRSARREHPPPPGATGLDGGRRRAALPGDRSGRARSPLARDLRRPRFV